MNAQSFNRDRVLACGCGSAGTDRGSEAALRALPVGSRLNELKRRLQRGAMLAEVGVALVVLSVAMILVAQMVAAVGTQHRMAEQNALAQQEAANLMERLFVMPWTELTQETASQLSLSARCRQQLPDASLNLKVVPGNGPPVGRQLTIEIAWRGRDGGHVRPVRLTAWRYAVEVRE